MNNLNVTEEEAKPEVAKSKEHHSWDPTRDEKLVGSELSRTDDSLDPNPVRFDTRKDHHQLDPRRCSDSVFRVGSVTLGPGKEELKGGGLGEADEASRRRDSISWQGRDSGGCSVEEVDGGAELWLCTSVEKTEFWLCWIVSSEFPMLRGERRRGRGREWTLDGFDFWSRPRNCGRYLFFFSFFTDLKLRKTPRAVLFSSSIFLVSGSVFSVRSGSVIILTCFVFDDLF